MSPGLAILDTWLMMLTATVFLWLGAASLYSKSGGADAGVALLGGVAGCALVLYWDEAEKQASGRHWRFGSR